MAIHPPAVFHLPRESVMKKLLQEPLSHFVLIGVLLFGLYQWRNPGTDDGSDPDGEIIVTAGQIESLAGNYARVWQRPPTSEELDGLIRDHITEEVYYREAQLLGLDRNDTIVRRRLRQKLEFISQDLASLDEPTEADLQAYLDAHPEAFQLDAVLSFKHVYLNPDQREATISDDVALLLATLRRDGPDADPASLGDRIMLGPVLEDATQNEISRMFGGEFVTRLLELPVGEWQGPVRSGYGVHLVVVTDRTAGRVPALAEVRHEVLREWTAAMQAKANDAFYQALLAKYSVTIASPGPTVAPADDRPR